MHFPSQCVLFCAVGTGIELALAIYNFINRRYPTGSSELKDYYLFKMHFVSENKDFLLDDSEMVILNK